MQLSDALMQVGFIFVDCRGFEVLSTERTCLFGWYRVRTSLCVCDETGLSVGEEIFSPHVSSGHYPWCIPSEGSRSRDCFPFFLAVIARRVYDVIHSA